MGTASGSDSGGGDDFDPKGRRPLPPKMGSIGGDAWIDVARRDREAARVAADFKTYGGTAVLHVRRQNIVLVLKVSTA